MKSEPFHCANRYVRFDNEQDFVWHIFSEHFNLLSCICRLCPNDSLIRRTRNDSIAMCYHILKFHKISSEYNDFLTLLSDATNVVPLCERLSKYFEVSNFRFVEQFAEILN